MVKIKNEGIILEHSEDGFDNRAVLNPACVQKDGIIHMFYRGVKKSDMFSAIGYCQLENNKVVKRMDKPVIFPEYGYEKQGIEDPRIVFLDDTYYLFFTVYDGKNALIAYATSADLVNFTKHGVISPRITYAEAGSLFNSSKLKIREKYFMFESYIRHRQGENILLWEKDAFIFPKKINNKFALVHRILPGIQVIYFDDFKDLTDDYWRCYLKDLSEYVILDSVSRFESRNVGGGCPPIETKDGWLLIYHAVEDSRVGRVYHAGAALLDINDPTKIIARLKRPLFSPSQKWEKQGDVNNVVFPTGTVLKDGRLYIYYGAADKRIAAKSMDMEELLTELKKNKDNF